MMPATLLLVAGSNAVLTAIARLPGNCSARNTASSLFASLATLDHGVFASANSLAAPVVLIVASVGAPGALPVPSGFAQVVRARSQPTPARPSAVAWTR